jgi:hypothetical protein
VNACVVENCPNEAKKGGKCWGHAKRATRGLSIMVNLMPRKQTNIERLRAAAIAYAEAESDEDFRRADERLRTAARDYQRRNQ